MARKKIWLLLVILFLAGTLSGLFLEFFFSGDSKKEIDIDHVEQSIRERQRSLNEMLVSFPGDALNEPFDAWSLMDSLSTAENKMLIYRNNQLVAWSDHQLPVHEMHPVFLNQPFVELDDGYYLVQSIRRDPYLLVGLFQVKQSFPHQNEYLKDQFLLSAGLSPNVQIVQDQQSSYEPVYGLEGEYLFSVSDLTMKKNGDNNGVFVLIAYLISVLSFWGLLTMWLHRIRERRSVNLWLVLIAGVFSLFYYFTFWHSDMSVFDQLGLFSPVHFAISEFLSSLGALLLFALGILLIAFLFFRYFRLPQWVVQFKEKRWLPGAVFFTFILGLHGLMLYFLELIYYLVSHSSGPSVFFKVIEINEIAVVKILILSLFFFSFLLLAERTVRLFLFHLSRVQMCVLTGAATLFTVLLWGDIGYGGNDWGILFTGLTGLVLVVVKRDYRLHHSYNTFLWMVALFALFSGSVLIDLSIEKEEEERELLVENLSYQLLREEDPVAEMYLGDIEEQIVRDAPLRELLARQNINQSAVRNHLLKYYFYGYWGRYDLQIVPCWPGGDLTFEETGETYDCYQYFFSTLQEEGDLIEGSNHFYYLNNDNGRVSYLGVFRFFEGHPLETTLFVELQSKPYFEGLGYPELLIGQKEQNRLELFEDYSYAKYVNGRLVKRSGDYNYQGNYQQMDLETGAKKFLKEEDYSHMVFRAESDTVVILSREDRDISQIFIAFSVFFIFFFVIGLILVGLTQIKGTSFSWKFSVQKQIQFSFVGLMLLVLLAVAIGTVLYTVKQFKNKHDDLLHDKVQSVLMELESKMGFENSLENRGDEYLTYQLQTISNVFLCDINLFGKDGKLLASSRPELFEEGLSGGQMNPSAYFRLAYENDGKFIGNETIGDLEYTSYYVPFYSRDERLLGYVNVPYFVADNELREEVSSVVMTVVNFYLLFSFIVIGIAVFLSRQITRPLLVLQSKLADLKIGQHNEKIDYRGDDEIGRLVGEYNRMVDELDESATKLARTERELAWREMARQIAHEIKNPLTPMKLSIQYLQRAWKDQVPDFDAFLNRVTGTLIEQIEKLSSIATEFSHFAQMPAAVRENVDILDKIRSSVTLYSNSTDVDIRTDFKGFESIVVNADAEQLLGVFNNLINNAIQSIPRDRVGRIMISTSVEEDKVLITVTDNGKGITEETREKMFQPNFTTKTSGMGLGLAIVKGVVETAGGKIWFDTETDRGTTFYIQLPVVSWS
ncbi:MAG: sensor histidine kinase [Marinilabiliaceae bacterium]